MMQNRQISRGRTVNRCYLSSLGEATNQNKPEICKLIPIDSIPVLNDIVKQFGCTTAGQAAAAQALSQAGPQLGPVLSIIGPNVLVSCVCGGQQIKPPPQPLKVPFNPMIILGAVILGGVGYMLWKKKQAAPAAAPSTPAATLAPAPKPSTVPASKP